MLVPQQVLEPLYHQLREPRYQLLTGHLPYLSFYWMLLGSRLQLMRPKESSFSFQLQLSKLIAAFELVEFTLK